MEGATIDLSPKLLVDNNNQVCNSKGPSMTCSDPIEINRHSDIQISSKSLETLMRPEIDLIPFEDHFSVSFKIETDESAEASPSNDLDSAIKHELGLSDEESTDTNMDFQFPSSSAIPNNYSSDGGSYYQCGSCKKRFKSELWLIEHLQTDFAEQPCKSICTYCNKIFDRFSHLKRHLRSHTNERPYKCRTCDKTYRDGSHLQQHERVHTGVRPFACHVCGRTFNKTGNLKKHMVIHTREKIHKCDFCDKAFGQACDLRRHVRTHAGEHQYVCNTCKKIFNEFLCLKRHLKTHSTERPYKCETCGKSFIESSCLNRHVMVHSDDKPFKCMTCSKSFSQNGSLKQHLRIHTGERPFVCRACERTFKFKSNLNNHLKTHAKCRNIQEVL